MAGMIKPNDRAEPTQAERLKNAINLKNPDQIISFDQNMFI